MPAVSWLLLPNCISTTQTGEWDFNDANW
jgi:hypothetical protein